MQIDINKHTRCLIVIKIRVKLSFHSLGFVIDHHIIVEREQLHGRLYSTPSLARPHERIEDISHDGDPIPIFILDRINIQLYLGHQHTYTEH
jgi:hypothetical protein